MLDGLKDILRDAVKEAVADKIPFLLVGLVLVMLVSFFAGRYFR